MTYGRERYCCLYRVLRKVSNRSQGDAVEPFYLYIHPRFDAIEFPVTRDSEGNVIRPRRDQACLKF